MSSNHFSYFRVKNFKRFKDLEVKDIGQFNLVLGDNNVGKTSLLEALTFQPNPERFLQGLSYCLELRGVDLKRIISTFEQYTPAELLEKGAYRVDFEIAFGGQIYNWVYSVIENGLTVSFNAEETGFAFDRMYEPRKTSLIPFSVGYSDDLLTSYANTASKSRRQKNQLIQNLNMMHPGIIDFEPSAKSKETLICWLEGQDAPMALSMLGQGTIKLFRYLAEFVDNQGFQVLLDEIDTGIHYSRMKDYWKVILQSAKENDVQIFATTHNRECIQYFVEALEELGGEYKSDARSIRLVEHAQSKEVISFTSSFDEISNTLLAGNEVR